MALVKVIGRDGSEHRIEAIGGCPLMESLRDASVGVDGTCGGACSCGTCHVYVSEAWLSKLPAKGEDEQMMLDALGDLVPLKPGSRLSCQIPGGPELEGLELEIAPAP